MGRKINMSTRDKYRWIGLGVGFILMVVGYFFPVPLRILEKNITDNAFLAVGFVGVLLTFGIVQLIKAVKGGEPK